jgi:tRNA(fMet)-specific endonuclease VapC
MIGFDNLGISVITIGEIYYGMRKNGKLATKTLISQFNKYLINKEICVKFMELMLGCLNKLTVIPDAFIAATAICNSVELYTLNIQDFNYIEGVKLYKPHYL